MIFLRSYFTSSVFFSKSLNRESRFLNKILAKGTPKKHSKFVTAVPSATSFPDKSIKVTNSRRLSVLNKLFMKYITDIMSTGNVDQTIINKGVEISKVAVTPDFQGINVFWYAPLMKSDDDMDEVLTVTARQIRHELSQLRVIGYVPKINFIRDKKKSEMEEVESILSSLQFPDTEEDEERTKEIYRDHIPTMTNNVYGLDHDRIMKKIIAAKGRRTDLYKKPNVNECDENSECVQIKEKLES